MFILLVFRVVLVVFILIIFFYAFLNAYVIFFGCLNFKRLRNLSGLVFSQNYNITYWLRKLPSTEKQNMWSN